MMGNKPWYQKDRKPMDPNETTKDIPAGLVESCKKCNERIVTKELIENLWVCPKCDHHHRIPAKDWIRLLCDDSAYEELDHPLYADNPLRFFDSKDYNDRLEDAREKTSLDDACVNAIGKIGGHPVIISALDFFFMGGSMGSVVGEKVTRGAERALHETIPFITISCSGGARMQEGMYSLMQLVKTSHACGRLRRAGVPFISVLADPSTAGVMASFASLGDVIMAEKGALIGFAGPRVIAQTIGGELPVGFQRADFCREHGMVDVVVHRKEIQPTIARLIAMFADTKALNKNKIK
jgi:acetyl-CoA carboxylase carboxyl transferase subunit beta